MKNIIELNMNDGYHYLYWKECETIDELDIPKDIKQEIKKYCVRYSIGNINKLAYICNNYETRIVNNSGKIYEIDYVFKCNQYVYSVICTYHIERLAFSLRNGEINWLTLPYKLLVRNRLTLYERSIRYAKYIAYSYPTINALIIGITIGITAIMIVNRMQ